MNRSSLPTLCAIGLGVLLGYAAASGKLELSRRANARPPEHPTFAKATNAAKPLSAACCAEHRSSVQLVAMQDPKANDSTPGDHPGANPAPGSPSSTTTIDGKYLPNAAKKFGGVINLNAKDSKPYWPPQIVPPKGAPNVLLIMTDDQGYGVSGTFGGVVPTPAMDRVAKAGLRYTQFHSTALCSPTRAALITGRNHHSVGFGVIRESRPAIPATTPSSGSTMPRSARFSSRTAMPRRGSARTITPPAYSIQHGRARSINGPSAWALSTSTASWEARPTSGRPIFREHDPGLSVDRETEIQPDHGYGGSGHPVHEELNASAPEKPFFLYYVPGGTHSPHQPTKEWIEKFKGKFDMGWNEMREQIFANQKRLGVIPANAQLTPWPDSLPKWDTLPARE